MEDVVVIPKRAQVSPFSRNIFCVYDVKHHVLAR